MHIINSLTFSLMAIELQFRLEASPSATQSSSTPVATKNLEDLTEQDIIHLLTSLKLSHVAPKLLEHAVTGELLQECEAAEELHDLGISKLHSKLLFKRIAKAKVHGIPLTVLTGDYSGITAACRR